MEIDNRDDGPLPAPASILWTQRRQELRRWFEQRHPELATAYVGAVELIGNPESPWRLHFMAHSVREILNRLVDVFDPEFDGGRVQYVNDLDKIADEWEIEDHLFNRQTAPDLGEMVSIPFVTARRVHRLICRHRESRARPSLGELLVRTSSAPNVTDERVVQAVKEMHRWFQARAHLRREPCVIDEVELQRQFGSFENLLHSFVGDFFTGVRDLDEILQQANR
jgi:hypothetical protein